MTNEISTHTPLAGRDVHSWDYSWGCSRFLLTRPLRGATCTHIQAVPVNIFLLTRPLRGATITQSYLNCWILEFLLTRPLRGATTKKRITKSQTWISTHTPLAGRDVHSWDYSWGCSRFLLTRPLRGATCITAYPRTGIIFLLTRPLRGATIYNTIFAISNTDFYSHAPCGARPHSSSETLYSSSFLLTRPLRGATEECKKHMKPYMISTHTPLAGRDDI